MSSSKNIQVFSYLNQYNRYVLIVTISKFIQTEYLQLLHHKMLDIRPLPEELQKIAFEELNETPEGIAKNLKDFRKWIELQNHLKSRTDDQFLISFLRGCKYDLEKAKSKLDKYYTLKTRYPDFYSIQNIDDPKVISLYRMG